MDKMKTFYGLRGLKLNIAIAIIAGTDFALFGYGEYTYHLCIRSVTDCKQIKVLWVVF